MADPIIMPKLGQMTEESKVVRWLKREGEKIAKGEMLLEIETDKAVMEVESFYDGTLLKILVQEGETVPVMATLAYVGKIGEKLPEVVKQTATGENRPARTSASVPERPLPSTAVRERAAKTAGRIKISPRAAGLAAAQGLDVRQIQGSGPGGRIIEKDVLSFSSSARPAAVPLEGEPLSRMRRVIARRLTESYTRTPHFFATVKVDLSEVERVRVALKGAGQHVSITDFIIKAAALALAEFPLCNARTDGQVIVRPDGIHVALAVALDNGLVVVVIRDANARHLLEISRATRDLTEKARKGKLTPEEMTGSTFTVSNLGMLDVESFTAIINPGESAILAVSSATLQPVVAAHEITVRPIMKMTLSSDHRLIDGALAARFLNAIRSRLEDRSLWWKQVEAETA